MNRFYDLPDDLIAHIKKYNSISKTKRIRHSIAYQNESDSDEECHLHYTTENSNLCSLKNMTMHEDSDSGDD